MEITKQLKINKLKKSILFYKKILHKNKCYICNKNNKLNFLQVVECMFHIECKQKLIKELEVSNERIKY